MNIRKMILTLSAALTLSLASCNGEPAPEPITFLNLDSASVISMIDAIEVADLTTEASVDDAYVAYCELDDSVKNEVTNIDKLLGFREDIAKLYDVKERLGSRIDHSKLLIGTYNVNSQCWTEEGFQALKNCGIDIVTGGAYNTTLLDLCEKYEIGVFLGYLPGWYGGDGSNAGGYASAVPSGTFNSYAENFTDHPAIWAMDVGDEPNTAEFPHYGVMIEEAKELFPDKQIYLNLYPSYAGGPQLGYEGTHRYYRYIEDYINHVDTDYICYDHYIYAANNPTRFFENFEIVSNAAIKTDRDFWVVLQVSADHPTDWITTQQLRYQTNSALAYGAKVIHWACWTAGWYILHPVDSSGNLTEEYAKLQTVNLELKALSPVYMRYTIKDTVCINSESANVKERYDSISNIYESEELTQSALSEIICNNGTVVAGYFEKNVGEGSAFMFTNVTEYLCDKGTVSTLKFKTAKKNAKVIAYYNGKAMNVTPNNNGYYKIDIETGDGLFITVD